jgi:hypothetical protein
MNKDSNIQGLSSSNRTAIVVIFTLLLLLWGPVEPDGLFIRLAYLVALPILLWLGLRYWGSKWAIDAQSNEYLWRAMAAAVAGAFLVGAYLYYTASYHSECTQEIRTRDGYECVGDYVKKKGPAKDHAFTMVLLAGFSGWIAISKRRDENIS